MRRVLDFVLCAGLSLALSPVAHAVDYEPKDLMSAYARGLPDRVLSTIAEGCRTATAVEKACMLRGSVPAELVAVVRGPTPTPWTDSLTPECVKLNLDVHVSAAELTSQRAAAKAAYEAREAVREAERAARARPACFKPEVGAFKPDKPGQIIDAVESWMGEQIVAGRTEFISLNWEASFIYQGSGGGSSVPILCAW